MISTLRNAWKSPDLRKRIIFTFFAVFIYRMGNFIPVPGVDARILVKATEQSGSLFGFYDLMSGGAFSRFSIFAMGVVPFINSSIIMQLLTIAIPSLEQLSKEGEEGRKKIQKYTRNSSIIFGLLQAFTTYVIITHYGAIRNASAFQIILIMITLTTASTFLMWLGDQITEKGIGNGISLIIFVGIISRIPTTIIQVSSLQKADQVNIIEVIMFILIALAMLIGVVIATLAERRIPVQYAGKAVGGKVFKGQSTHIPINMNASGIIAIIFAISFMMTPRTLAQFWPNSWFAKIIIESPYSVFREKSWQYAVMYFVLIVFFTWFYTQVTFKPDEMAENMHKSAGFIPGVRPGEQTAIYIERILTRVSILGGVFAALVAIIPILISVYSNFQGISFGGTALIIEVGVALETIKQLKAHLTMKHYHGFLRS